VNTTCDLKRAIEDLTGQKAPLGRDLPDAAARLLAKDVGLGFGQLNELLLLLGYDRVCSAFFQYLVNGETEYTPGTAIFSLEDFRAGVDRFRKIALLFYGNVKYAFKTVSPDRDELEHCLGILRPIDQTVFATRREPVMPIREIPPEETYYLGYLVEKEIRLRLESDPYDKEALEEKQQRDLVISKGEANYAAYLASDYLDVYVATSMRRRHEYIFVNRLTNKIFNHPSLKPLKLRWFDPTQAYCEDRIDKGLAEALMLKRANCTIYLAQESDTFGKDSELASTLAQGKTVVAYLPQGNKQHVKELLSDLSTIDKTKSEAEIVLDQLRIFDHALAWDNAKVRSWLQRPAKADVRELKKLFGDVVKAHYDKRAETLRESHPLGIQVNLSTGVATGVLVVRTIADCARLVANILTHNMEFDLETATLHGREYLLLRERISKSIFRVVTGDTLLTNTFWNYYLETDE